MNALSRPNPFNPPRFILRVSEFTVSNQVRGGGRDAPRVEFCLSGSIVAEDSGIETGSDAGAHPLIGRQLSVVFSGGAKPEPGRSLGVIQYTPGAPDIPAAARIVGCARRIAALRAAAHHAGGPLGGTLELVLDVAAMAEDEAGPVSRIPIRDALLRATRRFDAGPMTSAPAPIVSPPVCAPVDDLDDAWAW